MREWFLSSELMKLNTMPGSVAGISMKAKRENWKSRKAKGGGRSLEYHISNFDELIQFNLYCKEYGSLPTKEWKAKVQAFNSSETDINFSENLSAHIEAYSSLSEQLNIPIDIIQSWADNGILEENVKLARVKLAKKTQAAENFNQEVAPAERPISLDFYDIDVSAGPGTLALQEHTADPITFNKDFLTNSLEVLPEDVFLMPVRGDSMVPTLKNQAVIMVKKIDLFATDGIYVFRFDGQLMVKRLQFSKTGLSVVSDNPTYKEWEITREETETVDFEILGEVIWSGQRM